MNILSEHCKSNQLYHPVNLRTIARKSAISGALASAVPALMTASMAYADPLVDGLEILWPDDGWYQVQSADGSRSICEGTRSCLVEPGRYIVINHTTGQRFENIEVSATSASDSAVTVNGNTISMADDGWYQVQSAATYESICQGERQCTVEDGNYNVINHTTGKRYEGIVVAGGNTSEQTDTASERTDTVVVNGSTISWPDDGWYQVQSADTFESLCEGGSSCNVSAGDYIVINHTTGERFETTVVQSGLQLDTLSSDIIAELAGVQLEQSASHAPDIAVGLIDNNTGYVILSAGQFIVDDRGSEFVVATNRNQYACAGGGTMTLETGVYRNSESDYSHVTEFVDYVFNNCQADVDEGVPVPDTYRVNGQLTTVLDSTSAADAQSVANRITYSDFKLSGDLGFIISASANIATLNNSGDDLLSSRTVSISEYLLQLDLGAGAQPMVKITDAALTRQSSVSENGSLQSYSLNASGTYSGEITDGMDITVSTISPLSRTLATGGAAYLNVPFNGQLQMSASDGTQLTISGVATAGNDDAMLVNYDLLSATGDASQSLNQTFSDKLSEDE